MRREMGCAGRLRPARLLPLGSRGAEPVTQTTADELIGVMTPVNESGKARGVQATAFGGIWGAVARFIRVATDTTSEKETHAGALTGGRHHLRLPLVRLHCRYRSGGQGDPHHGENARRNAVSALATALGF